MIVSYLVCCCCWVRCVLWFLSCSLNDVFWISTDIYLLLCWFRQIYVAINHNSKSLIILKSIFDTDMMVVMIGGVLVNRIMYSFFLMTWHAL